MPQTDVSVTLVTENSSLLERAKATGDQFGFVLRDEAPAAGLYLYLAESGLELRQAAAGAPGPVRVDFIGGKLGHRLRFGGGRGQPLARAAGMKPRFSPSVWDATAGLGRDGFVLASLGSRVTLCERSPVLAALLQDGLRRACADVTLGEWVGERLTLIHGDSRTLLERLPDDRRPDTVYLDPMYPAGKRQVLVKKEMRALQQLLGPDRDSAALLDSALRVSRRRVVVKRPKRAGWLHDLRPDTSVESRKTRYDIYVTL
ncbi:MAG TPA: 16S rRNA methyltransferase [Gammaproteobacteria bacterium]|nr:16S rRNA methyltransferase [Gammaproteobacteria bacterium]